MGGVTAVNRAATRREEKRVQHRADYFFLLRQRVLQRFQSRIRVAGAQFFD